MLEKEPSLTPDEVKARLMKTAFKALPLHSAASVSGTVYKSNHDLFTVGAGYLDIAAALANNDQSTNSARSPIAVYERRHQESLTQLHFRRQQRYLR